MSMTDGTRLSINFAGDDRKIKSFGSDSLKEVTIVTTNNINKAMMK